MVIDAPGVDETTDDKKGEDAEITLTDDTAQDIMNMINRLNK